MCYMNLSTSLNRVAMMSILAAASVRADARASGFWVVRGFFLGCFLSFLRVDVK